MEDIGRNKRVLVLIEREVQEIASITYELLNSGMRICKKLSGTLSAAVLGHKISDIVNEVAYFSDEVYSLDNILLKAFQVDIYAAALENLCGSIKPEVVLMGHTFDNLDLAPRLAHRIGAELIPDCNFIDIEPESEHLLCTKPIYGERAVAIFEIGKKPQMATRRSGSVEAVERNQTKGKLFIFDPCIDKSLSRAEAIETILGQGVSLDKADVIVGGGRGVKTTEGINLIEELIGVLRKRFSRVELGASRPLVDSGLAPRSRQIGQTGERASPQLYIAVGISGASQHLSGILGAKKIVAINKDEQASIFDSADCGVVGNYEDVLPALIKKLAELL